MWKRLLVLVLFLFGVFWWIGNRDDMPTVPGDSGAEVTETEETDENAEEGDEENQEDDEENDEEASDEDSDDEGESDENDESENQEDEESKTPEVKDNTTKTTPTPVVTVKEEVVKKVTQPVVVVPVYKPKPKPKPVPVPAVTTEATVYLYEWGLDMSQKTFPAGTINFTVKNSGRRTHDLGIRGVGNLGKVTSNSVANFSTQLRPGTYEVFSGRGDDYARGVVDTIVVE